MGGAARGELGADAESTSSKRSCIRWRLAMLVATHNIHAQRNGVLLPTQNRNQGFQFESSARFAG